MDWPYTITAFVTLFVVMDPIGLAPLFLALTPGMGQQARIRVARRALLTSAILLTLFGLVGESLLTAVGISIPAFRIAGGVLLFLTAMDMLFERRTQRREGQTQAHEADPSTDPSVFPLATPLIAGPGALASMILLMGQGSGWGHFLLIEAVMLAMLAVIAVFFRLAGPLGQMLGRTGIMVVTRLLGMLLAALAIQFILDGLAQTALFA